MDIFLSKCRNIILYIVTAFLMGVLRNKGWYVFLFSIPEFIYTGKKYWKKIILIYMDCCF